MKTQASDNDAAGDPLVGFCTRRGAVALLVAGALIGEDSKAAQSAEAELADRFAIKRRAYQTGNVELLREFYDENVVVVGEGMKPLVGLEPLLAAYRILLPKRRDIHVQVIRAGYSKGSELAYQFVRFEAFASDPAESLPVVTFLFVWRHRASAWRCVVELLLRQDLAEIPDFSTVTPAHSGDHS